jgi:hypothetical protein
MSRQKPLKVKATTQNGTPVLAKDRNERHNLWLHFCNSLEEELGPCKPDNVMVYQERLEGYNKTLGHLPTSVMLTWPTTKMQIKQMANNLGTNVFAIEYLPDQDEVILVAYVGEVTTQNETD